MAQVWVVRHGETDWNRERRLQGHTDVPLNDVGRDQARAVAQSLKADLGERPCPPVWTSDLIRAKETAQIVGQVLGATQLLKTVDLRERRFGVAEGKTWDEMAEAHPEETRRYRSKEDRDCIPDMEPRAMFKKRVLYAVRQAAGQSDLALAVTHGGVIKVLLEECFGTDVKFMIGNTAVYRFRVHADRIERVVE